MYTSIRKCIYQLNSIFTIRFYHSYQNDENITLIIYGLIISYELKI